MSWGTTKFFVNIRGVPMTHELWLPQDLNEQDVESIAESLKACAIDRQRNIREAADEDKDA